ncbi:Uncharacterised protein [Mycobacteroides abscessus subsp. abscessus]|nr:Uncharacterised protein [Mycobacteroides abscessus subsp. abscessus]
MTRLRLTSAGRTASAAIAGNVDLADSARNAATMSSTTDSGTSGAGLSIHATNSART